MSDYKTHIFVAYLFCIGLLLVLLFFKIISFNSLLTKETLIFAIPVIFLYSILPDIDHKTSKITWILLITSAILIVIGFLALQLKIENETFNLLRNLLIIGIGLLVATIVGTRLNHRGITHTYLAAILFSAPLIYLNWIVFTAGFISYASHLIMDGEYHLL